MTIFLIDLLSWIFKLICNCTHMHTFLVTNNTEVILPLSGTSSFSNDTVLVHGLSLFTVAIAFVSISQFFFGELKLIDRVFTLLNSFVLFRNRKKLYLSLWLLCLNQLPNIQPSLPMCKQMYGWCTVTTSGAQWQCVT